MVPTDYLDREPRPISFRADFDKIDRGGRSLGRLQAYRDIIIEIGKRTSHMDPSSTEWHSLVTLAQWIGNRAENERP